MNIYCILLYGCCIFFKAYNVIIVLLGDLFSVISVSGNGDVLRDADYTRKDEMEDERVDLLLDRIKYKFDWSNTE